MKKSLLLSLFSLISFFYSIGQATTFPCGFDIVHQQRRSSDSSYNSAVMQLDERWKAYSAIMSSAMLTYTSSGYVYEIPIVLHVLHTGGAIGTTYNPDSTTLAGMVTYLNKSYAAESPFPDTTTGTSGGGTRIPLKFVLAKRTPTGGSTNGIIRINASTTLGSTYTTYGLNAATTTGVSVPNITALSRWNSADYYNVYIVNKIDGNDLTSTGGIAGFAYFPGAPTLDGMYVVASQAKTGSTTVSHEFGHAFSLYHTFEGDAGGVSCPSTTSCSTTGDLVCDTEPHIRSSSSAGWCPATDANPCTGGGSYNKTQYNIMDYTLCPPNRYTAGQRTRVMNTLDNERVGYKTSSGLLAPAGTIATATCTPTASTPNQSVGPYIVEFNGMKVWTGSAQDENANYVDHSYTQQSTVRPGSSYTISVTTRTNAQNVKAFIDYNNDGDFIDAGEEVFSHGYTVASGTEVHTGTITIPTTGVTKCTYLRMRVVAEFGGSTITNWSCGPYVYGQAEDYAIYVQSSPPVVSSPVALCQGVAATALTATGSNLKWYTVASGGTGATSLTPSTGSVGSTKYYVSQSTDGSAACESARDSIIANVSASPTISGTLSTTVGSTSTLTGSGTAFATSPWTSSAPGIATVSGTGVVSGVSPGTTTITYKNNLGCSQTALFTVTAGSTISGTLNACVGSTSTLTGFGTPHATTPWSSSSTAVATVSSVGVVRALSAGTATITYTDNTGTSAAATFTVNPAATINGNLTALIGASSTLSGTGTAHTSSPWASSNTRVATISSTGIVTAVGLGKTLITYTNSSGCTDKEIFSVEAIVSTSNCDFIKMNTGDGHSMGIRADSSLWAWGYNGAGQLGNGTLIDNASPILIDNTNKWKEIECGEAYNLALTKNNVLYAWGDNLYGQLGDGTTTNSNVPKKIGTDSSWLKIANGRFHSLAIKNNGTLWAWGRNNIGQLGDGTTTNRTSPIQIGTDSNWVDIAGGFDFSVALKSDGTLWAWGYNAYGQFGNGTTTNSNAPIKIGSSANWVAVNSGFNSTYVIQNNGTLWAAGDNSFGQLGDGTTTTRLSLTQIGTDSSWARITSGDVFAIALKSNKSLWGWGYNVPGVLGDGTYVSKSSPTRIGTDSNWALVNSFYRTTGAIKTNGTLHAWGWNFNGAVGDGSTTDRNSPTLINPLPTISGTLNVCVGQTRTLTGSATAHPATPWTSSNTAIATVSSTGVVTGISAGSVTITYRNNNNCTQTATFTVNALPTITGTLNAYLGGTSTLLGSATADASAPWTSSNPRVATVSSTGVVTAVGLGTCIITYKNSTGCENKVFFTVGAVPSNNICAFTQIGSGHQHSLGIRRDSSLWAWGNNANGQLGDATFTTRSTPVRIGTLNNWKLIRAGRFYSVAINHSGKILTWGDNTYGQLGDGTTTNKNIPTLIGSDSNWSLVEAGFHHTVAIKNNGSLWAWGWNNNGQLGDGTTINRTSPIRIGTDSNWKSVATGAFHTVALKTDGSIWAWGYNANGEIGDGTTTYRYSPTRIGTGNNWVAVYSGFNYSMAIRSDGSLWAWGWNGFAQLGDGTTTSRLTPTRIGTDSSWAMAEGADIHTVAIKSNGGQWAWGDNSYGQLGDGTTLSKSSPTRIGTDSNWIFNQTFSNTTLALKSDGSLMGWGQNNLYQIGDGSTTNRSNPTLINILPSLPSVTTPISYCQGAATSALATPSGTGIKWYTVPSGGTASTTAPTPSSTTPSFITYYVTQTSSLGCENRAPIEVYINPKPDSVKATALTATTFCIGDSVILNGSTSIFSGFGSTAYLSGSAASGSVAICDCPNGSVVTGYQGNSGGLLDRFTLICKPINRFGVLGATTTLTSANGIASGPNAYGPYTFASTGMMVGLNARNEVWSGGYFGEVTAFGQSQAYITGLGNNSLSPLSLSPVSSINPSTSLGNIFTPSGTVASGMYAYPTLYSSGVSLRYTPIGAYIYSYSWSSAPTTDTNSSLTVKTSGSYSLTVTNSLGCSATSAPVNVNVNFFPAPPTVSSPVRYCLGGAATPLTATKSSATDTLYWYATATGGVGSTTAPTPSTSAPGTTDYFVSEKNPTGCESTRTMISVIVDSAVAPFQIVTADSSLCLGESTLLRTGTSLKDSINAPYTGGFTNDGLMFDVKAKNSITINSIDMAMGSVPATASLSVYYKSGAYAGYEGTSSAWTLLGSVLPTAGVGGFYNIPVPMSVNVMDGQTVAFYLAYNGTGSVLYNTGTSVGNPTFEDANMQVLDGRGVFSPLFGGAATPRALAGKIRYTKFNAIWSTGATADTITVAPTVTTKYWARITNWLGCNATDTIQVQVNPLPTISGTLVACVGQTSTLSGSASPHPTTPWTSSNTAIATVSSIGVVTGVSAGTVTITYRNANDCIVTTSFTVNPLPTISGTLSACVGQSLMLTGSATAHPTTPWTSSNTAVATISGTGVVTAVSAGTTIITYTNANGCSQTATFTVNPLPTIGITVTETSGVAPNDAIVCSGNPYTLTASGGGTYVWKLGSTPFGGTASSLTATTSTGLPAVITFRVIVTSALGCVDSLSQNISVNPLPSISGTLSACVGLTSTLTGSATPHATTPWTSSNTAVATVSSTGVVTGVSAGTTTITYRNNNGCVASATFTVNALAAAPSVTSPVTYCQDATATALVATGTSLKWYTAASGGTASTIAPTPSTTTPGIFTYYVTQSNAFGCENSPRTPINVIVNPKPVAVTVTPATSATFCIGDSVILNGSSSVFTNFGNTPFFNAPAATGTVYTCDCPNGFAAVGYEGRTGSWMDRFNLICKGINRLGVLGSTTATTITNGSSGGGGYNGPYLFTGTNLLVGVNVKSEGSAFLNDISGYGQSLAYILALGDNTSSPVSLGMLGGGSPITNLGTGWAPNGSVITGMYSYPTGYSTGVSFRYTPIGAFKYTYLWSTSATDTNSSITVKTSGTYTLTVTNSLGCSATSSPVNVIVNPLPTISGVLNTCVGQTSTLTGSGTPHPTAAWTSSNTAVATVSSTGIVTGVSSGTVNISYMNNNGCVISSSFVVNPLPLISGTLSACVGQSSTLTGSATAHATTPWTSSNTAVATVNSTGVVTGVSGGSAVITYRNTNGCTQSVTFTVNPLPTIGGALSACIGSSSSLTGSASPDATTPWTSSNTTIATISSTGVVTALAVGTTTITYKNSNGCTQSVTFTVNPLPIISGTFNTCIGSTSTLTGSATAHPATPWTSSNTAIATVSATGVVTGVSAGTVMISYMNANGCVNSSSFTVNPLPTISGTLVACVGQTSTLTGSATAHATTPWTSSNTAVATVSSAGVVTGVSGGTTIITYRNTNGCTQTATFLVNPLPTISGTLSACVGQNSTLSGSSSPDATTPWTSSNTSVATISSTGVVSGLSAGTTIITYKNSNGCSITANFTVNPLPLPPVVTTPVNLCIGVPATALTATGTSLKWYTVATGGTSSSTAPTPSTSALGTTNYYVSQTNTFGCEGPRATIAVTVQPSPVVSISSLSPYGFIFCKNLTVSLKANAATAVSWQWDTSGIALSGRIFDTVAAGKAGKWGVTVKNVYGCINRAEVEVYMDSTKPPILSPTAISICEEGSALLTCSPGFVSYTFEWMKENVFMTPPTLKENLKNVVLPGSYSVRVTNNYGCIDTTNIAVVSTYPKPLKPVITNLDPILEVAAGYLYYQWYHNNKQIPGANSRIYVTKLSGDYFVEVTDENGCLNNSDTVKILQSNSVKNIVTKSELKIYPNPTREIVYIESPIKIVVRVTDVIGRVVYEGKNPKSVSLANLAAGHYFFRISDENDHLITVEKVSKIE